MADTESSLIAKFELIDNMSSKMDNIASRGDSLCDSLEQAGDLADQAFTSMEESSSEAGKAMEDVTSHAESLTSAFSQASSSSANLSDAASQAGSAMQNAADSTDYWTDAAGNYDKSALEAVYTTQELVDMGFKTADALQEEAENLKVDQEAFDHLNGAIDSATQIQDQLSDSIQSASEIMDKANETEGISADRKNELAEAMQKAAEASDQLAEAQKEADAAQENYNNVAASGSNNMDDLEEAASRAEAAAEDLAAANEKASEATENLGKASEDTSKDLDEMSKQSDDAGDSMDDAGATGVQAFSDLSSALTSLGISATIKKMSDAAYDLATSYSDASKIIVNATGATGDSLASLNSSALQAFAQNDDDLNSTAATVGELNTRLGLTGDKLTQTTQDFMDFADVTNSYGVTSVQNVTKIMNRFNMSADDMSSLMDDLVYAGQISGASVDQLSQSLIQGASAFQSVGMHAEQAINFLSQMELYGLSSTQAITALNKATVNFSNDGIDASQGLQDVIKKIATMKDQTEATQLAADTFGTRVGVTMANAIRNGAISVDTLTGTMDQAQGSLEKTAEAGESLTEKWEKASNSVKSAFIQNVQSPIYTVSASLASLVSKLGDFLAEHPKLTKAIAAVGTGLGVAGAALAGVVTVVNVAIPALTAFGTAATAALGPIGLLAVGIAAVSAAVVTYQATSEDAENATEGLTAASTQQYEELQSLQGEYENAVETYGQNSEEALRLKYQVDDLTDSYNSSKQTVEDFTFTLENAVQTHEDMVSGYEQSTQSIEDNQTEVYALVQKLADLESQGSKSNATMEAEKSVLDEINNLIPGLNMNFDDLQKSGSAALDTIKKAAKAQAEQDLQTEKWQEYVGYIKDSADQQDNLTTALKNYSDAEQDVAQQQEGLQDALEQGDIFQIAAAKRRVKEAEDQAETYKDAADQYQSMLDQDNDAIAKIEAQYGAIQQSTDDTTESTISYQEAAAQAYESVADDISNLAQEYQDAYDTTSAALNGVFGLFDTFSAKDDDFANSTVSNAQKALDSQLQYWNQYSSNLQKIRDTTAEDLGVTQQQYNALVTQLQDGSEQSAGLAQSIVSNLKQGNTDAVAKLAETAGSVESKKDEISKYVADWQTDFNEKMDDLVEKMDSTIDELDLSSDASANAKKTIEAYANSITSAGSGAVNAAQKIVDDVAKVFASSTNIKVTNSDGVVGKAVTTLKGNTETAPVEGNATGTTRSADVFVAGEEGPELVVGKKDSTVFPESETEKIIDAVSRFGAVTSGDVDAQDVTTSDSTATSVTSPNVTISEGLTPYTVKKALRSLYGSTSTSADRIISAVDSLGGLPAPVELDSTPEINIPEETLPQANGSVQITSKALRKILSKLGSTDTSTDEGNELVLDQNGNDLTYDNLDKIADKITRNSGQNMGIGDAGKITSTDIKNTYDKYMQDLRTADAMGVQATDGDAIASYFYGPKGILTQTMQQMYEYAQGSGITPQELFTEVANTEANETTNSDASTYDIDTLSSTVEKYLQGSGQSDTAATSSTVTLPEEEATVTPDGETAYNATIDSVPYTVADSEALLPELTRNTEQITSGDNVIQMPQSQPQTDNTSEEGGTKTIRLEINGSGAISVPAGTDKDQILQIMQENLKPTLMKLIDSEIYEEGTGTYDY